MKFSFRLILATLMAVGGLAFAGSATAAFPDPYCARDFTFSVEPITLVAIDGINNPSSATIDGTPALEDFTGVVGQLAPGGTYSITVKGNTDGPYTSAVAVYFDWDQDENFGAGEGYYLGELTGSTGTDSLYVSAQIPVPATAVLGQTRMRVVKAYTTTPGMAAAPACGNSSYGQAEDYTVDIDPNAPVPPGLSAAFSPSFGDMPATTNLSIGIDNGASVSANLTGDFIVSLPAGLELASPANATSSCVGTLTAVDGGDDITLASGGSIPVGGCSISADIAPLTAGQHTLAIDAGDLATDQGAGPAVSATYFAFDNSATVSYDTGFESPFTTGALNGQQGWSARNWNVATTAPANGDQHIAGTSANNPSSTNYPLAISPDFAVGTTRYAVISANLRLARTGNGATWRFNPQDPDAGMVTTIIQFDRASARNIQTVAWDSDGNGTVVDTGASWPVDTYFDFKIIVDRATGGQKLCMDGSQIYEDPTSSGTTGGTNVSNLAIAQVTGISGQGTTNSFFVDDLMIEYSASNACDDSAATWTVTPSVGTGDGTITPDTPQTVDDGDTTSFTLTPDAGFQIDTVGGTCGGTLAGNVYTTDPVTADCTVEANFAPDGGGSGDLVCSGPINHAIANNIDGTSVNWITGDIQDADVPGYHFNPYNNSIQLTFWWNTGAPNIAGVSSSATTSDFLVLQDGDTVGLTSIWSTANNPGPAAWAAGADGYLGFRFNCAALPSPPAGNICYGYVHLQTTAPNGFPATIVDYCYDKAGNAVVIGGGTPVVTWTVTPSVASGNGTITPDTPQTVDDGDTTSFTLTPDAGFQIDTIGGTCGGTLAGNVYTTDPVTADCTVEANFAPIPVTTWTVTPSVGTGDGTITPDDPQTVDDGDITSFTLTPDAGFHIDTVGGTCGGTLAGNVYTTDPVTADCTVVANFAADAGPNPDLVCSGPINHAIAENLDGTSINWETGDIQDSFITAYHFNPYSQSGNLAFYWLSSTTNAGVASGGGTSWDVLGPGDTVGSGSTFSRSTGAAVNWDAGADGYLGFRFPCTTAGTCYGYAHMTSTGPNGFPAVLVDYCYDEAGNDVTIGSPPPAAPSVAKIFTPDTVELGEPSVAAITLSNPGGVDAVLTAPLVDNLPAGLTIVDATTTCLVGTNGSLQTPMASVTLPAGAVIPANGSCTIDITVQSATAGTYVNTIAAGDLQTDQGDNIEDANATLTVFAVPVIDVTPGSLSASVDQGDSTTQTLTISNNGGGDLAYVITETEALDPNPPSYKNTPAAKYASSAPEGTFTLSSGASMGLTSVGAPIVLADTDISQMDDNTPGNEGVSCGQTGVSTADNSWWRRFYFNEHSQVGASADVKSVTISTGSNTVPGGLDSTINLYTIPHSVAADTIDTAQLTLIGTANATVDGALASVTIPVTGSISDTSGLDLVVEWHTDGNASGQFFPGANGTPETHPTFMSSSACGIIAPTPAANIGSGFPNFHLTMVVTLGEGGGGTTGCANPTDIPWLSVAPGSGTVAAGGHDDVTVSFDSTGLASGTYEANLCVASNDPVTPEVSVPVSLEVISTEPDPAIDVDPATGFAFTVDEGDADADTLTITNIGGGTLTWAITEADGTDGLDLNPPSFRNNPAARYAPGTFDASVSLSSAGDLGLTSVGEAFPLAAQQISQMDDNTPGNEGVSCGQTGVSTADNSWWRRFYFAEHPQVGATAGVTEVTISTGANAAPGGLVSTINLYTIPHSVAVDTIDTAQLTLIGTADFTANGASQSVTVPVTGYVADTVNQDLVVEWHTDGNASGQFFPGANATPETHPTFMSSSACGIAAPTPAANIGSGFPNFHLTMVVTVDEGTPPTVCDSPTNVPWLVATPSSGSLTAGASDSVTVGVDASALVAGNYEASLCVASNDPLQPMIPVPVLLTVESTAITDRIFCNGFEDGEDGQCHIVAPGDIVESGPINHPIPSDLSGTSVDWITGDIQDGAVLGYHFNPYNNNQQLTFWWNTGAPDIAGVSSATNTSDFLVLQSGAVVGPSSTWSTLNNPGPAAWAVGADGYLGFRFNCSSLPSAPLNGICYGYVHLQTTAPNGFPATIVDYAYDQTGAAITIP